MGLPASLADDLTTPPAIQITAPAVTPLNQALSQIKLAATPSAAIQAYADVQTVSPGNLVAENAFVRRMVELGLPEMAESQAQDLIKRTPDDGLAWAVSAYIHAKRDQLTGALYNAAVAVELLPGDEFVQRTAGQIVAWFDSVDKAKQTSAAKSAANAIRIRLAGRETFAKAYMQAAEALASKPSASTDTQTTSAVQDEPVSGLVYGSSQTTSSYQSYSPVYTTPAYSYWWPVTSFSPGCWWFPNVVITPRHFPRHDRDFDRDDRPLGNFRRDAFIGNRPATPFSSFPNPTFRSSPSVPSAPTSSVPTWHSTGIVTRSAPFTSHAGFRSSTVRSFSAPSAPHPPPRPSFSGFAGPRPGFGGPPPPGMHPGGGRR